MSLPQVHTDISDGSILDLFIRTSESNFRISMAVFRILLQNWKPVPNLISRIIHPTNIGVCVNPSFQSVCKYSTQSISDKEEEFVPERLYSKINVKVKSFDYAVLDSYMKFVITAGKALGINMGGKVALPTRIQKFTVLKSPHVYKKHRVQYEMRNHSRLVQIKQITGTTADVFLEYIQRNLPEGVTMSVYQEELDVLPKLLMEPLKQESSSDKVVKKR